MLLNGSYTVLQVEVASHTADETYSNERVPSGFEFWSVRIHVTQLEVVFLYRFLQEVLAYISLTLALRPPALPSRAAAALSDRASAAAAAAVHAELVRGMGTVLQLDVRMEAPVIVMPRDSSSPNKVGNYTRILCAWHNMQPRHARRGWFLHSGCIAEPGKCKVQPEAIEPPSSRHVGSSMFVRAPQAVKIT